MWNKLEILIPVIVVLVSSLASFIGARIGRRDLLTRTTEVLNEQGDEAILQYRVIKTLLNIMMSMVECLNKAHVINGNGDDLRKEIISVQEMLEKDVVKRKEKMFFVRKKWQKD